MMGKLKTEPSPEVWLFCHCGKRLEYNVQCDWYVCPDLHTTVPAETLPNG
jgi:hypothetical protein